jgi:hypothetical protein
MSNDELCRSIERLIQQHLRACQQEVAAAVERTFRTAATATVPKKTKSRAAKPKRESGPRRTPAQVHALGERFYDLLSTKPGANMTVYAAELGVTPRELHRPVALLKRAKLVRSVGDRQATRYFPLPLSGARAA